MPDDRLLSVTGPVATLTIDNPPLNVLTEALRWDLYRAVEALRPDASVRVVLLRGGGERAFSAGSDLKEFPLDDTGLSGLEKVAFEQRVCTVLQALPQVTIAALSGHVLGGGAELALACDLRIAADSLRIGFPEIKVGAFPGASGTQRLLRLVGPAKARELLFFGQPLGPEEALRLGLVNRVVPRAAWWAEALAWAEELCGKPWQALQAIKRCLDRGADSDFAGGLRVEAEETARIFRTADLREGLAAFREKRPPSFQHR